MNHNPKTLDELERNARKSLEAPYGHPLTDEEWAEAKQHLLGLARALRDSQRKEEDT